MITNIRLMLLWKKYRSGGLASSLLSVNTTRFSCTKVNRHDEDYRFRSSYCCWWYSCFQGNILWKNLITPQLLLIPLLCSCMSRAAGTFSTVQKLAAIRINFGHNIRRASVEGQKFHSICSV